MDTEGWSVAWTRGDSSYTFVAEDYERAVMAWKKGEVFFKTRGVYGAIVELKLSCVESLQLSTPESIAAYKADQEEEKWDKE